MKVDAKEAFEIARDLAGRTAGRSGDDANECELCRSAADGKRGCHGATGDVDSDGAGSSLAESPNRSNPETDRSFSLKSPR